jgi:hypothetical protein
VDGGAGGGGAPVLVDAAADAPDGITLSVGWALTLEQKETNG